MVLSSYKAHKSLQNLHVFQLLFVRDQWDSVHLVSNSLPIWNLTKLHKTWGKKFPLRSIFKIIIYGSKQRFTTAIRVRKCVQVETLDDNEKNINLIEFIKERICQLWRDLTKNRSLGKGTSLRYPLSATQQRVPKDSTYPIFMAYICYGICIVMRMGLQVWVCCTQISRIR